MTREERRWCLGYAALLAGLTTLPYLFAYSMQGSAWRFSGFVFAVEDGNSYIAKMLLGEAGAWLFRTPFTAFPQQGVLAYPAYLLLGKLASGAGLHEQLVGLFHLFRILATPVAVLATYRFVALFVAGESWRRWATVLATAGGGLGWVLVLLGQAGWLGSLPLDLHSPETFGFLAFFGLPHLVLARALMLLGLASYLEGPVRPRRAWAAGALFLGMGLLQPLAIVSVLAALAAHQAAVAVLAWHRHDRALWLGWLRAGLQAALPPVPLALYTWLAFARDPYLKLWQAQNLILSPHPAHYLVAYGLILVPAAIGGWWLIRRGEAASLLPVAWALAIPELAYAPYNLQRRLPEGSWVALAALAAAGLAGWAAAGGTMRRRLGPAILALSLPSTALLWTGGMREALTPAEPAFVPAAETQAFAWLAAHAEPGSVVLGAFDTGNALPAWAPVRVVAGHGPESADLAALLPQIGAFYRSGTSSATRLSLVASLGVRYVFVGAHERALGDWDPSTALWLHLRYDQAGYAVFEVDRLAVARAEGEG